MASVTVVDRFVMQPAEDFGGPGIYVNVRDMATGFHGVWTKHGLPVHGRLTISTQAARVADLVRRNFSAIS